MKVTPMLNHQEQQQMEWEITTCVQKWVDYSHTVFSPNNWICMPTLVFVNKMKKSISAASANYAFHSIIFSIPTYIANHTQEFLDLVVAHEVSHLIAYLYHKNHDPFSRFIGHGRIWKDVMRRMGREPKARSGYNLAEDLIKKRPFEYACECTIHNITSNLHKKIQMGKKYACRGCKRTLVFQGDKKVAMVEKNVKVEEYA